MNASQKICKQKKISHDFGVTSWDGYGSQKITMLKEHKKLKVVLLIFSGILLLPEFGRIPVQNATAKDWNVKSHDPVTVFNRDQIH